MSKKEFAIPLISVARMLDLKLAEHDKKHRGRPPLLIVLHPALEMEIRCSSKNGEMEFCGGAQKYKGVLVAVSVLAHHPYILTINNEIDYI